MNPRVRVLYGEDEADIREVVQFALEDENFELVACASGREVVQRAAALQPDLILLDVMMPDLDGPTTLQQLRTLPHLATTPAIFMTAKVQPAEMARYRALGARGVITKPFNAMSLADDNCRLLQAPA